VSFDWTAFVEVADWLNRNPRAAGPIEASRRTAIGRAYYGAFGTTLSVVKSWGISFHGDGRDHRDLVRRLRGDGKKSRRKVGADQGRLLDARHRADYEARIDDVDEQAHAAIQWARNILAEVRRPGF